MQEIPNGAARHVLSEFRSSLYHKKIRLKNLLVYAEIATTWNFFGFFMSCWTVGTIEIPPTAKSIVPKDRKKDWKFGVECTGLMSRGSVPIAITTKRQAMAVTTPAAVAIGLKYDNCSKILSNDSIIQSKLTILICWNPINTINIIKHISMPKIILNCTSNRF